MSKLADAMKGTPGRERRAVFGKINVSMASSLPPEKYNQTGYVADAVIFSVSYATKVFISGSKEQFNAALLDAKRSIVHEVFGEFRADLNELRRAIWEREEPHELSERISRLESKMFDV